MMLYQMMLMNSREENSSASCTILAVNRLILHAKYHDKYTFETSDNEQDLNRIRHDECLWILSLHIRTKETHIRTKAFPLLEV